MRQRVNQLITWKDVMNVIFTNARTVVNSVLSTEPSVVTGTRGTSYAFDDFTLTADTLTISNFRNIPIFIDEADRFQQSYFNQMEIADFQGKKILEYLESQVLAQHASWVDFGAGDLNNTSTDDTAQITISASNIDDLIRAMKRKVYTNNGADLAAENGFFVIWRPQDWELLEGFVWASGYSEADIALKNGIPAQKAFYYGGVNNYLSTGHTANHLFAGVRKVGKDIAINRGTWGQAKFLEDPAGTNGNLSGLGIVSRIDYGFSFPSASTPATQRLQELGIDINVA